MSQLHPFSSGQYVFTYPGKVGPVVRRFVQPIQFDAWVKFWREHVGPVEWISSRLCKGSPV